MSVESSRPHGEVFLDARGHGRALRLTWHHEADVVVLSLWRDALCAGTFRLAAADVSEFIDAMVEGLRHGQPDSASAPGQPNSELPTPRAAGDTAIRVARSA